MVSFRPSAVEDPAVLTVLIVTDEGGRTEADWPSDIVRELRLDVDATGTPPNKLPEDAPITEGRALIEVSNFDLEKGQTAALFAKALDADQQVLAYATLEGVDIDKLSKRNGEPLEVTMGEWKSEFVDEVFRSVGCYLTPKSRHHGASVSPADIATSPYITYVGVLFLPEAINEEILMNELMAGATI